jgi:C1A family cysteine protease
MGWRRDTPDFRDFTPDHSAVRQLLDRLPEGPGERPRKIDLREHMWPVEDQGRLGCSTAYACLDLVEYFEHISHGLTLRGSRMFLYHTTRRLMGVQGDAGADLRTTLKAMVRFGAPPATYWPHENGPLDDAPCDPFLYGFAADYPSICYVRLDVPNLPGSVTLEIVKSHLAAGFPCVFGFPVPSSVSTSAYIPYRPTFDSVLGGQAVVAVGYDDDMVAATKGALLFRNCWGAAWGDHGYGWLPYTYVERRFAVDFWTLLKARWLDSGEFSRPTPLSLA